MLMTLRTARERKGWTQEQLAAAAHLRQSQVSKLERTPTCNPKLATVRKLESALGLRAGTLLFGEEAA